MYKLLIADIGVVA